jgi:hypothetical protein
MAGTIVADTVQNGAGTSTSMTNVVSGACVAWVNFYGVTTTSIYASYNVSSITRNGAGDYTVNFTNALTDANYAVALMGTVDVTNSGYQYFTAIRASNGVPQTKTASAVRIASYSASTASVDSQNESVIIHR